MKYHYSNEQSLLIEKRRRRRWGVTSEPSIFAPRVCVAAHGADRVAWQWAPLVVRLVRVVNECEEAEKGGGERRIRLRRRASIACLLTDCIGESSIISPKLVNWIGWRRRLASVPHPYTVHQVNWHPPRDLKREYFTPCRSEPFFLTWHEPNYIAPALVRISNKLRVNPKP